MTRVLATALFIAAVAGCGGADSTAGDDYGNLLNSPEGLILVREEHPTGWSRPDCFACHEIRNMHRVNRTGLPDLDLAGVRLIVSNQGEASCVQCHGMNGVEP